MPNFCIFRTAKLKTDGNVAASISHALRTRDTPNANNQIENWTNLSVRGEDGKLHVPDNAFEQAMARYRKTLPQKIGKGRVPCVELMMTVSPEVMARKDFNVTDYLNDCDSWAREVFGKDNVFFCTHHRDEKTPHTSIFLVPKVQKKYKDGHVEEVLAAKQWLGGRDKLSKLQDDFFEKVGKKHRLNRGIKNSRATHENQKKYYEKINQLEKSLKDFTKNLLENIPRTWRGIDENKIVPYLAGRIESLKPFFEKAATAEMTADRYKKLQDNFEHELQKKDQEVEKKVDDRVIAKTAYIQNFYKQKCDKWDNFIAGKETTIQLIDGRDFKMTNGVHTIDRIWHEIEELESLSSYDLEELSKKMQNHHWEYVEDAYRYAEKHNIRISEIPDQPKINRSYSYGRSQ